MTIPKKPTRQRTSSPKIPAAKAPPKVAAKPEPKSTGRPERKGPSETLIAETILRLLAAREAGKTICPSEAARALDPEGWRRLMPQVRATAVGLARQGRLVITRHGKPAADGIGLYRGNLQRRSGAATQALVPSG